MACVQADTHPRLVLYTVDYVAQFFKFATDLLEHRSTLLEHITHIIYVLHIVHMYTVHPIVYNFRG